MPIFDKTLADLVVALVGDESDIQPIFGLMPQKIAVVPYADGTACLSAFEAAPPKPAELILLDATKPGTKAEAFLSDFRSNDDFRKVPVVVLVDKDDEAIQQTLGDLGANLSLTKSEVLADQGNLSQIITDFWMSG